MQGSGKGSVEAIHLVKKKVSARKIAANRENAKKSTGPKTIRGKEFSRRNAVTHGLLARQLMDFSLHGEDPREYGELLDKLREEFQPIGNGEELEVERIALCWWKNKRLWRHENALNRIALCNEGSRELALNIKVSETKEKQENAVISMLESASEEIESQGEISPELKHDLFAIMPDLENLWPNIEAAGQETQNIPGIAKMLRDSSDQERARSLAVGTALMGVKLIQQRAQMRRESTEEIVRAKWIIPRGEDLDRILRYDAANDRSLHRSLDRLERLQKRRREEQSLLPKRSLRVGR